MGPFDGVLEPGRSPAVLAIDLMRAYFDDGGPLLLPSDECLAAAARVLAAARAADVPVVHTRVEYAPDGSDGGTFVRRVPALRALFGGGRWSEHRPEVAPAGEETVLTKQFPSAFFGTGLHDLLQDRGVDTVVLVGVSTSGCVRATAVDAISLGYVPLVVREAVGDRTPAIQQANLADLQAKCAEVVAEQAVVDLLQGGMA